MKIKAVIKRIIKVLKQKEMIPIIVTRNSNELFSGKIALITGGSGSIGSEIAERLVIQGCKVIISGTNEEKLKAICEKINKIRNGYAKYIEINTLNIDLLKNKIAECVELFDEKKIDILINSAGIYSETSFLDITENEYDRVMDINLKGLYFTCKFISEIMIKNKIHGHILNVSSASALRPAINPYAISKWGVRGFTVGLADELIKYNITVNAIGPGPVASSMNGKNKGDSIANFSNPSKRYATVEEIAELACYMVSESANLVIGDTFYISGGGGVTTLHN